jgi:hypothetical protein
MRGNAAGRELYLLSGAGWFYVPAGNGRRMERRWWQFEYGSARARA